MARAESGVIVSMDGAAGPEGRRAIETPAHAAAILFPKAVRSANKLASRRYEVDVHGVRIIR